MTSQQLSVAIWLGGSVALTLLGGLIFGLLFFLLFSAWVVSKWNVLAGVALGVVIVALFFGPGFFDRQVFERQLAQIRAQEVTGEPLDLTGANVMFMGMSGRYHPEDCTDLCRNIAAFGAAENVYFGFNRSLDLNVVSGPIDLLDRDILQFEGPLEDWPRQGTPMVSASPERIDYVVYQGGYLDPDLRRELLPEVSSFGGFFPFSTIYNEYLVYPVDDARAFDASVTEPIFTRFEVTRNSATLPGLPFVLLGDLIFDHRHGAGQSQWNSLNTRDAATFLCGAIDRPDNLICRRIP